ncbi:hypothetical protein LFM09_37280 [Lentzea alba]|uniref:hypothetical protein n=1 Tax=Lentzea alba TaxID=2714351 RepID=UPI0039BF66E2
MPGGVVHEALTKLWWRVPLAVAALAVSAVDRYSSLFVLMPVLLWCMLARTRSTGLVVGLVLLMLQAWVVVPRGFWWAGPWVPSPVESFWLYALLAAIVSFVGVCVERREAAGVLWLLALVGLGFVGAGNKVLMHEYDPPGWEGVLPGPPGVHVTEGEGRCDSGRCWRELAATGERAHEVMRVHLESRGFTAVSPLAGDERLCRRTGVTVPYEVCAELRDTAPGTVRVTWYVD